MLSKPQAEHEWLQVLIGTWEFSHLFSMGPGQPKSESTGRLEVRTLGGLWVVMEGSSETPEHGAWASVMTLGYEPASNRYVGTFIGSMMANLWIYDGHMDNTGRKLILDTEGPKMNGSGVTKYQDIVEIVDQDHWTLWSKILGDDGEWQDFLEGPHRRLK